MSHAVMGQSLQTQKRCYSEVLYLGESIQLFSLVPVLNPQLTDLSLQVLDFFLLQRGDIREGENG